VTCGGEVLRLVNMSREMGGVVFAEEESGSFFAAEPSCTASCLADQCPQLPMPETSDALMPEDIFDYL
jgi:hypothetical protein